MLKLLVMDSDKENIKNFKTYIKLSFPEIKMIYTLSDQKTDIMSAVMETMPELIIADIRFFGVAAQKIIRDISEMYPDIKFILYGTYNDADYLQRVLEYGVIDYMYRPVKPAEFKRCMQRAIEFFDNYYRQKKEKEIVIGKYLQEKELYKNRFLDMLVTGKITNPSEIQRSLNCFDIGFEDFYTVFIIRIDHFKKIILTLTEQEIHLLTFQMRSIIDGKFRSKDMNAESFIREFNHVICILSEKISFEDSFNLCTEIKNDIFYNAGIKVTIGLGRTYDNAENICISYQEALSALKYRFEMGHGEVIPIHFVEPMNTITHRYPIEKEEKLVYTAAIGEYKYCHVLLRELCGILSECEPLSEKYVQRYVMGILFAIGRHSMEQNMSEDIDITAFFSGAEVIRLKTIDDAYLYLNNALKGFCAHTVGMRHKHNEETLIRAKEYIKKHYYENISISKIAVKLDTTGEYLNKLFLDQEKISYFDYTVGIRIEEAKRMLAETQAPIDAIAVNVGYDDVRHFKGVFKQHTGHTVSEYRMLFNG